ncbi:ABC transporter ATP-binding protein [Pseudohongiella nitratireducens]|uniref:ABC transporter ATP-binding protein n=1 Tax=Pseudohongiella nitratireducens TaxID=1768907 RepID=UPI0030EC6CD3|tara:strand:+ start:199 stop:1992 length:1794 start_codon:yes stop_codon:yes gene_type:complete
MYKQLKKLYQLLSADQRKKLLRLQLLVVLMAFAEVGGVFAIGPFMALVADMSALHSGGIVTDLFQLSGLTESSFIFWVGVSVLLALTVAACISMLTTWRLATYSFRLGAELGVRLFKHYMQQPWLFHANGSSSTLINKIAAESGRMTGQIINPLLQMIARLVLIVVMAIAIFIYDPKVALSGLVIFSLGYFVLYRTARRKLQSNGRVISNSNRLRMSLMQEGFGGIKDTLLLGRQADFNERFEKASREFGRAQGNNAVLAQVPRYAMELLAFGSIILLVLYLLSFYNGNLSQVLPTLAVYSLAGFRLLPAFQQVYVATTSIRGNIAAFENLLEDFENSQCARTGKPAETFGRLSFKAEITLANIHFCYPGKEQGALNGISIRIPANKVIGVVGASGSGKSTAIDILLGLIEPDSGQLLVDGKPINSENRRAWQNSLGYVSQAIFLSDSSIRENIAFGLPSLKIDEDRVKQATRLAHLDELVDSLPEGLDTRVGERGIQLSGGQRQRIGIARALYSDADVLVFDEATSALDGITERLVMDAIHDFTGKKTIVLIAHRLATVKACNCIYLMSAGQVIDSGSYDELIHRNKTFRKMAAQA